MIKIKHSKYKNTGMIFELLARQITADIISQKESPAINIVKKFFNSRTELHKEYALYKTLCEEKYGNDSRAKMIIDAVIKSRRELDISKLKKEKYELVKSINENFNMSDFFQTKVNNYKLMASIYKILEYSETDNPAEITRSKVTIMENIVTPKNKPTKTPESEFSKMDNDLKLRTYTALVEKFNDKYKSLSNEQKNILSECVISLSNTNKFNAFIKNESQKIKNILVKKVGTVKDEALKIKLNEVVLLLDQYPGLKKINENHVSALMRYYEIIKDI
ncbi:hypothetical protein [Microcystis phage Mel-JY01]